MSLDFGVGVAAGIRQNSASAGPLGVRVGLTVGVDVGGTGVGVAVDGGRVAIRVGVSDGVMPGGETGVTLVGTQATRSNRLSTGSSWLGFMALASNLDRWIPVRRALSG